MLAIVREVACLSVCGIDQHQIGCVDVFIVVRMRYDDCQRFTVRRDLWIGNAEDLADPGEIKNLARRGGDRQARRGCCSGRALAEEARVQHEEHSKNWRQKTLHGFRTLDRKGQQ